MNKLEELEIQIKIMVNTIDTLEKTTEQECIGFAEWVISQEEHEGDYTVKELYKLYQKSKENE